MADQKLHAILGVSPRKSPFSTQESDEDLDYQAFSFGRVGTRPVPMICFIKADGYHLALPYVDLRSISTIDPDKGFKLDFGDHHVAIEGQLLQAAFRYIRENRLCEVTEVAKIGRMSWGEIESIVTSMAIVRP